MGLKTAFAPMCWSLKERIKSAMKRSNQRIDDKFCEVVTYLPMIQNMKILGLSSRWRWSCQRVSHQFDRRFRLIALGDPFQHQYSKTTNTCCVIILVSIIINLLANFRYFYQFLCYKFERVFGEELEDQKVSKFLT